VVIAATQDFITAAHLITRKNLFLTRGDFARLCCYMGDAAEPVALPPPPPPAPPLTSPAPPPHPRNPPPRTSLGTYSAERVE
jgi:hypothetical protein